MQGFAILIMLFFSILATVLIMLMAGITMLLLLFIFAVVAIVVGAQQQSVLKGLKVLTYASALIVVTPLAYLTFRMYAPQFINISSASLQIVALLVSVALGIGFALTTHKTFEKITKFIYNKMTKKHKP